jgi:uncharacterized membrane protein
MCRSYYLLSPQGPQWCVAGLLYFSRIVVAAAVVLFRTYIDLIETKGSENITNQRLRDFHTLYSSLSTVTIVKSRFYDKPYKQNI